MIKEVCLMDLLREEKNAVFDYNYAVSRIADGLEISRHIIDKENAERELKEIRGRIKEYMLKL